MVDFSECNKGIIKLVSSEQFKFQLIINTDDEEEMNTYIQAPAASAALYEFYLKLRSWDKHGFPRLPKQIETPDEAVQYIREVFNELLSEYVK